MRLAFKRLLVIIVAAVQVLNASLVGAASPQKVSTSATKTVYLILDAHASSDAQQSMAKILEHLQQQGVQSIGLEGADQILQADLFRAFPYKFALKQAALDDVKKGELSGAEYFYIQTNPTPALFGLENRELYLQNREAFLEGVSAQPISSPILNAILSKIRHLQKQAYSPELFRLTQTHQFYEEGNKTLLDYLEALVLMAKTMRLSLRGYPELGKLAKILDAEKKQKSFDVESLQSKTLMNEVGLLNREIYKRALSSKAGQKLYQLDVRCGLLTRMLNLKLTENEWRGVSAQGELTKNFNRLISDQQLSQLVSLEKQARNFYQLAEKRNDVFVQKIIWQMKASQIKHAAVVLGGFHEEGVRRGLQAEGVSVEVLTPTIRNPFDDIPYLEKMSGEISPFSAQLQKILSAISAPQTMSGLVSDSQRIAGAIKLYTQALAYQLMISDIHDWPPIVQNAEQAWHLHFGEDLPFSDYFSASRSELRSNGKAPDLSSLLQIWPLSHMQNSFFNDWQVIIPSYLLRTWPLSRVRNGFLDIMKTFPLVSGIGPQQIERVIKQVAAEAPIALRWGKTKINGESFTDLEFLNWNPKWAKAWRQAADEAGADLNKRAKMLYVALGNYVPNRRNHSRISEELNSIYIKSRKYAYRQRGLRPPEIMKVKIPFTGQEDSIPGYLFRPEQASASKPVPGVIVFHGLTNSKEQPYLDPLEVELIRRGIAVLRVDFFSHGENKIFGQDRDDIARFVEANVQFLKTLSFIDVNRLGLFGFSFGGHVALRGMLDKKTEQQILLGGGLNFPVQNTFSYIYRNRPFILLRDHLKYMYRAHHRRDIHEGLERTKITPEELARLHEDQELQKKLLFVFSDKDDVVTAEMDLLPRISENRLLLYSDHGHYVLDEAMFERVANAFYEAFHPLPVLRSELRSKENEFSSAVDFKTKDGHFFIQSGNKIVISLEGSEKPILSINFKNRDEADRLFSYFKFLFADSDVRFLHIIPLGQAVYFGVAELRTATGQKPNYYLLNFAIDDAGRFIWSRKVPSVVEVRLKYHDVELTPDDAMGFTLGTHHLLYYSLNPDLDLQLHHAAQFKKQFGSGVTLRTAIFAVLTARAMKGRTVRDHSAESLIKDAQNIRAEQILELKVLTPVAQKVVNDLADEVWFEFSKNFLNGQNQFDFLKYLALKAYKENADSPMVRNLLLTDSVIVPKTRSELRRASFFFHDSDRSLEAVFSAAKSAQTFVFKMNQEEGERFLEQDAYGRAIAAVAGQGHRVILVPSRQDFKKALSQRINQLDLPKNIRSKVQVADAKFESFSDFSWVITDWQDAQRLDALLSSQVTHNVRLTAVRRESILGLQADSLNQKTSLLLASLLPSHHPLAMRQWRNKSSIWIPSQDTLVFSQFLLEALMARQIQASA